MTAQMAAQLAKQVDEPKEVKDSKVKTKKAAWTQEMEDHLLSALGCRSMVRYRGG